MYRLVVSIHEVAVTELVKMKLLDREITDQAVVSMVTQAGLTKHDDAITALPGLAASRLIYITS